MGGFLLFMLGAFAGIMALFMLFSAMRAADGEQKLRGIGSMGLVVWGAVVLYLTVLCRPAGYGGSLHLNPFTYWHTMGFLQNTVLFLPLGFLLRCRQTPLARCVLIGALTSLGIEAIQLVTGLGIADISDVMANALGTWLGARCFGKLPWAAREKK